MCPDAERYPADYSQRRDYGSNEEVPVPLEGREIARIPRRDLLP